MRLIKFCKKYSVPVTEVIDFLKTKGYQEAKLWPTAILSNKMLNDLSELVNTDVLQNRDRKSSKKIKQKKAGLKKSTKITNIPKQHSSTPSKSKKKKRSRKRGIERVMSSSKKERILERIRAKNEEYEKTEPKGRKRNITKNDRSNKYGDYFWIVRKR